LIDAVNNSLEARYQKAQKEKEEASARLNEVESLRKRMTEYQERIATLEREASRVEKQYQRELERTQVFLSKFDRSTPLPPASSPQPDTAEAKASLFQRFNHLAISWRVAVVSLILALGVTLIYLSAIWYRSAHYDSMLNTLYSTSVPPAIKSHNLDELVHRYKQNTFDSMVLNGINLDTIQLDGISLRSATLENASFRKTSLRRANFAKAELSGATFNHSDLSGADLRGAKLIGADLTNANLTDANLRGANLEGADLTGASISPHQLDEASVNDKTILPEGYEKYLPQRNPNDLLQKYGRDTVMKMNSKKSKK
jgi:hypothetical protein